MSIFDRFRRKQEGGYVLRVWNPLTGGFKKVMDFPNYIEPEDLEGAKEIDPDSYYRFETKVPRGYGKTQWWYPEQPPDGGKPGQGDVLGISKAVKTITSVRNELGALQALFGGVDTKGDIAMNMLKLQSEMFAEFMKGTFKSMGEVMSPFTMMFGMPEKVADKLPTSYWMMRDEKSIENVGKAIGSVLSGVLGRPIELGMPPVGGGAPQQQGIIQLSLPPPPPVVKTDTEVTVKDEAKNEKGDDK